MPPTFFGEAILINIFYASRTIWSVLVDAIKGEGSPRILAHQNQRRSTASYSHHPRCPKVSKRLFPF